MAARALVPGGLLQHVYLGEHYLIDAIAGVVVAALAYAAVQGVSARLPGSHQGSRAPTI